MARARSTQAKGVPLATFDGSTLFGGDERGYSDYPSWDDISRAEAALEMEVAS